MVTQIPSTRAHTAGVRAASANPSSARILAISAFLSLRWSFFPSPLRRAAAASAGVSVELPAYKVEISRVLRDQDHIQ